jgi:hypothetical protein
MQQMYVIHGQRRNGFMLRAGHGCKLLQAQIDARNSFFPCRCTNFRDLFVTLCTDEIDLN